MSNNTFAMMVCVRGDVSVEEINTALGKIHIRHPALVTARGAVPNASAAQVMFPLSVHVNSGDNDWIEVAQTELSQSFSEGPPPYARFTLFKRAEGFDLLGVFHHHICDGMSGMFVMRDILQALGNPDHLPEPIPAPPPRDQLIPAAILANPSFQRKLDKTMARFRRHIFFTKLRKRFFLQKETAPSAGNDALVNQIVILPSKLTVSQTAALTARCKEEQVSVHAAICVAWLRALISQSDGEKREGGYISSPVNIRQRISPPIGDTSGGFLTIVETYVDCAPGKDFWQSARTFKQNFAEGTRDELLFFKMATFRRAFTEISPDDRKILGRMLFSMDRPLYDFSITNLGRLPIPQRNGRFEVEAFYGPLVNSAPHERTVGVSTLGGQMSLSLMFRKSKMDPATGQDLLDRSIKILAEAANSPQ